MNEAPDDIDWELANSYDPLALPASDRISILVHYDRDRTLQFIAESLSYEEEIPENTLHVHDGQGRWRALGRPITRKSARPQQLEDPEFIQELAAQMSAAPMGVHRPTEETRIDIDIRQPGFMERLFGAREIGGAWIPKLRQAIQEKVQEDALALQVDGDEIGPAL